MRKKWMIGLLTGLFAVSSLLPGATVHAEEADEVTQGELALLMVNVLGLYRFLPAAPTEQEAIAVLLINGIAPEDGWDPNKPVVLADLARLIVQALDRAAEVENPEDPQSWMAYLDSIEIPISTVGLALSSLEPLAEPLAGDAFSAAITSDPLKKQMIIDIMYLIPDIPPRPLPVTPD